MAGKDIPERLRLHGVADAARVDPALTPPAMGKTLVGQSSASPGPILLGDGGSATSISTAASAPPTAQRAAATQRSQPIARTRRSRRCSPRDEIARRRVPTARPDDLDV